MALMPRFEAFKAVSASKLNDAMTEIERISTGVFSSVDNAAAPLFRVSRTTDLTLATSSYTVLPWQTVGDDPDGMWDPGAPGLLTVRTPGVWVFQGALRMSANGTNHRINEITRNSTNTDTSSTAVMANTQPGRGAGYGNVVPVSWTNRLEVGDLIRNYAYQDSGSGLTLVASANPAGCSLSGFWIGP